MPRQVTVEEIIEADNDRRAQAFDLASAELGPVPDSDAHWVAHDRYQSRLNVLAQQKMQRLN